MSSTHSDVAPEQGDGAPASANWNPIPGPPGPAATWGPPPVWVPPVPVYPYTRWIRRVGAYLIDFAPTYLALIPLYVGYLMWIVQLFRSAWDGPGAAIAPGVYPGGDAVVWMVVGGALWLLTLVWLWYNRWLRAGRTGRSLGKRVVAAKLVAEVNGQPIGPVNAFLRDLLHTLDGILYIGYLWPLWDAKRQTFADMIMKTVVIDQPAWQQPTGTNVAVPLPGDQA